MNDFITKFPISEEVVNIFEQGLIEDKNVIVQMLEEYKFLTREQILNVLKTDTDYPFISLDDTHILKPFNSEVVYYCNESEAYVYIYGFTDISCNVNRIELQLSQYNVHFYRITPYNFRILMIPHYAPTYDALVLFKRILLEALKVHATDIHFDTKHFKVTPDYTVAFRIDGDMHPYTEFLLDERLNKEIISKLVEVKTNVASLDLNSAEGITAVAKDVLGTGIAELRISANQCLDGYHYVIRIQKADTISFTLNELGFHPNVITDLSYITRKRSGITLITGAVRTGKNTTAFAIENEMVKLPIKLVSYEYPIEVLMPVSQVDYANNEEILLNAIRLAKKQDVNVAFLNEIPNKEVAFAVQDLVNSSIHVITTMHLDRLRLLPYRLKEYYGASYKDVISQINGVFNQKMFSVPCPHCQQQILVDDIEDIRKRELLQKYKIPFAYRNSGCTVCNGTGHIIGRNQPYAEHLLFTSDIIDALLECDEPYQMEHVLQDALTEANQALEVYMTAAIGEGKLAIDAMDSIV